MAGLDERTLIHHRRRRKCIKFVRSMYGNVDAALRRQKAFIKLCTNDESKCIQSKTDPCMLYKRNQKGKICLMIAVYVDDVLMVRESENIKIFKEQFRKRYKITDLGKLKKYLGVWYKWIKNDEGGTVKEWNSPGYPSIKLAKPENDNEIYK